MALTKTDKLGNAARTAALGAGAFGVAVSGAGPTLLAVVPGGRETAVADAVLASYASEGIEARLRVAAVDAEGARVE